MLAGGALSLTVNVSDLREQVGKGTSQYLGEGKKIAASVSVWVDSLDERGKLEEALRSIASRVDGYLVTESMPLQGLDRDWADGTRSPGVTLWTAFPKPERLSDEAFYERWHGHHTPLSFEIHPLWEYTRNAVARVLTPGRRRIARSSKSASAPLRTWSIPTASSARPRTSRSVLTDIATFTDFESSTPRR